MGSVTGDSAKPGSAESGRAELLRLLQSKRQAARLGEELHQRPFAPETLAKVEHGWRAKRSRRVRTSRACRGIRGWG